MHMDLVAININLETGKILHMQISKVFTIAARIEALTWAGLLIGMFLKYSLEVTELGVWLFGRLHGAAFLVYFFVAIIAAIRLRWPWWCALLAVLAAMPPLVTFPLEIWFHKRGLLEQNISGCDDTLNPD